MPKTPEIDEIIEHYKDRWGDGTTLDWWNRKRTHAHRVLDHMCAICKERLLTRAGTWVSTHDPKKNDAQADRNELDLDIVLHIQQGKCPDAIRTDPLFPENLPLRDAALPDFLGVSLDLPKHVFQPVPLPDPELEDTPITDLVIPADCMAVPLFWRTGELHTLSRHRVKTINVGDLIAYRVTTSPSPSGSPKSRRSVASRWTSPGTGEIQRVTNGGGPGTGTNGFHTREGFGSIGDSS